VVPKPTLVNVTGELEAFIKSTLWVADDPTFVSGKLMLVG